MRQLIDFLLHSDVHLAAIVQEYGGWTYAILCSIIFCETGLVFLPILPGDSLLFAAGSLAALGHLRIGLLVAALAAAAVIGDNVNYWIGRTAGKGVARGINPRHLEETHLFFSRHGRRAIILARFVPIVRTVMPFVAGLGRMEYRVYLPFDIAGGLLWVMLCSFAGYWFGNLPVVRHNFTLVVLAIVAISLLPVLISVAQRSRRPTRSGQEIT